MKAYLKANEERILKALRADLGKSRFRGYATDVGIVYDEINTCLKHLNSWTRPRRVASPIVHFRSSSKVYPAARRGAGAFAVELPATAGARADGGRHRRRQLRGAEASRTSKATSEFLIDMLADIFPPEYICGFPDRAR